MYLHEEYIKRHDLNIPIVLYQRRTIVLLKNTDSVLKWSILAFNWREPDRHPGYWTITLSDVIHNGHNKTMMQKKHESDFCHFDQYETRLAEMLALIKTLGVQAVPCKDEMMGLWQIFLCIFDSWLAKNADPKIFDLIAESISLNENSTRTDRYSAFERAKRQLFQNNMLREFWTYSLLPLAKTDSSWLVDLINKKEEVAHRIEILTSTSTASASVQWYSS